MASSTYALARRMLPSRMFYAGRQLSRRLRKFRLHERYTAKFPSRRDLKIFSISPDAELHVFWKVLPIGRGPAFSLFIHEDEVLRFDCFGEDEGHYHAHFERGWSAAQTRLYFFEASESEQIDRVEFELLNNLDYYLQRHPWARIRAVRLDRGQLETACAAAGEQARAFLRSIPELAVPAGSLRS
ncbi:MULTISPECIES: hypothetical protein [unclassified Hyphomonas]|nr:MULTISPECIES: hypothetical protein [unclassified Hyphomonas]